MDVLAAGFAFGLPVHVAAYLALAAALGLVSWRLTVRWRIAGYVIAALAVAAMVTFAVWLNDDVRWSRWIPGREVWLWSNVNGLGAAILAGVAARALPPIPWQRVMFVLVLLALGVYRSVGILAEPRDKIGPGVWVAGGTVCRQTTKFTCGPAAVASALAAVHVHTTESEMAREALTSNNGTSNLGMYRALTTALDGTDHRVAVYRGRAQDLGEFPAVISITVQGTSNVGGKHAIAVLGKTRDGRFVIADPFVGRQRWTPDQLAKDWLGWALVIK